MAGGFCRTVESGTWSTRCTVAAATIFNHLFRTSHMPRSLWKGAISFGLVHIPVQLFSAENKHDLDLDMLDKRDFAPIGYKRYNKRTGKEVDWDNIVKGYEYEPDQYVVLSDEDLKRANVKATGTIDILTFVDAADVPILYYEQPYYLAPDRGGDKVYALLRETLRRAGKVAIAQIVLRTKQRLVALLPVGDMIVLDTLRYADELRPMDQYDVPKSNIKQAGISEKEIQMALSLVEGMTDEWDPAQFHDTYREDVMAMVKKKIKANQTKTVTEPEDDEDAQPKGAQIIDLMELLKQSVNSKGGKAGAPAKKAARPKKSEAARKTSAKSASRKTAAAKTTRARAPAASVARAKPAAPRRARA
jgi:DNA end-binding protein Ku